MILKIARVIIKFDDISIGTNINFSDILLDEKFDEDISVI